VIRGRISLSNFGARAAQRDEPSANGMSFPHQRKTHGHRTPTKPRYDSLFSISGMLRYSRILVAHVLTGRLNQSLFFLLAYALTAVAHASYGQMRLDGVGLILAVLLAVAYGVIVDVALIARIFRYRAAVVGGVILGLVVICLLLSQVASPSERTGFFKGSPGGAPLVVLVVTSAVFLPFVVIAPIAQHLAMRQGRRWPRWVTAWMIVQVALVPGFLALAGAEAYFWQRDYVAGQAEGKNVRAGRLDEILARADQRHERVWGTPWTYPWPQKTPAGSSPRSSGWVAGLTKSLDTSALIAANEPLAASDRTALAMLIDRHIAAYAKPHINAKLLWDKLEPGRFSKHLAPRGVDQAGAVGEEEIPVLLERLEQDSGTRMCPGGRMMDADRAVLTALILKRGRVWNVNKRDYEMRPDWVDYAPRVERLCRAPV